MYIFYSLITKKSRATKRTPDGVLNLYLVIAENVSALEYGKDITFVFVGIVEN
jgi:hypothetical protein